MRTFTQALTGSWKELLPEQTKRHGTIDADVGSKLFIQITDVQVTLLVTCYASERKIEEKRDFAALVGCCRSKHQQTPNG